VSIVTGERIPRKFKNKMKKIFIGYSPDRVSKYMRLGWLKCEKRTVLDKRLIDMNKSFRVVCLK